MSPRPGEAEAGERHVLFAGAAHFVFGAHLGCLWPFARLFARAASGRQRLNVPGALNAVTRELIAVTNAAAVGTATVSGLLRGTAARGPVGPVTPVLDNARYQRNAVAQALAGSPKIELPSLPPYSPNLKLIERPWRPLKRESLDGRYHPAFADSQGAIRNNIALLPTKHKDRLASLMTLNSQVFDDVSFLAA